MQVEDNGRGIPVKPIPKAKDRRPAVEVVLTTLNAGGKFGGDGYRISGGLHGVGVSVVNALSSKLTVQVMRDGFTWTQSFARGKATTKLVKGKATTKTGTIVTFWPDPEIFVEGVEFDPKILAERLQEQSFLTKGIEIQLIDEREGKPVKQVFKASGGIVDFVKHLASGKEPIHTKIISMEARENDAEVDIALQWTSGYAESLHSFANTINTHEGGMHEEGLKKALTNVVNRYARNKGLLKEKEENLLGEDVREGLIAIVSVRLRAPQFEGQTKTKLGNTTMRSLVETTVNEHLMTWLEEHPGDAKRIVLKSSQAQKARLAAKQARDLTRRKSFLEGGGLPGKLADCQLTDPRIDRALHRRGRLGRRLGQAGPGPGDAGDPADPGQDPERREGPSAQDPRERGDPGADHRDRDRRRRRVRRREGPVPPDRADGRRRRRRRAHPDAAAHVLLPAHARADRRRLHLRRATAPVPAQGREAGALLLHRARVGPVPQAGRRREEARSPAVQGPRRDGRRPALGARRWTRSAGRCCGSRLEDASTASADVLFTSSWARTSQARKEWIEENAKDVQNLDV